MICKLQSSGDICEDVQYIYALQLTNLKLIPEEMEQLRSDLEDEGANLLIQASRG